MERSQHIGGHYQPHIYEVETNSIPDNQVDILKKYLFSHGFSKEELEVKTTYELVYMAKKHLISK